MSDDIVQKFATGYLTDKTFKALVNHSHKEEMDGLYISKTLTLEPDFAYQIPNASCSKEYTMKLMRVHMLGGNIPLPCS